MTTSRTLDLSDIRAVDAHCHPLLPDPWIVSADRFADFFTEGRPGSMTEHARQTGYFLRAVRDLARRFGTEAAAGAVLEARRRAGADVARRAFEKSRIDAILIDTGYPPEAMSIERMRALLPCRIHEIFRIETCAQNLLSQRLAFDDFLAAFRGALEDAAARVVAFKSVIAYRSGLAIRSWPLGEARAAYRAAVARVDAGGPARLTEKPLLDTLLTLTLAVCRDTGRPLQLHTGFGDPDIDLIQANPVLLRPLLEDPQWADARLVILHMAYPYFREAAFMAAVWPQVHVDLSLALPFLGPGAVSPLIEMLSLAPAGKLFYGSDVGGLPELFALSADWARASLGDALGWLIEREGLGHDDARRIAGRIFADNAMSLYRLPSLP